MVARPESAGYSSELLEILRARLRTQDTTGLMEVTGGRVLLQFGNVVETSRIAPVRRSVIGILSGKYVAKEPRVLHTSVRELGLDDLEPLEKVEELPAAVPAQSGRHGCAPGQWGDVVGVGRAHRDHAGELDRNIGQEPNRNVGMLAYQTMLQMLIGARR